MVLQNKIGELFRLLRGEIRAENYTVILLFIYLRSTNLFSDITQNEENQKESLIEVLKNTNETTLRKIFNVFLPTINKLSEQSISDVLELLKSIDSDLLNENISEIYGALLNCQDGKHLVWTNETGETIPESEIKEWIKK